ncbi:hypothetical protein [Piscirickettsia salmonis]|uniref:hypothetical protein n=1 Tax=Piscirickettsia salmonis TaxID=1238 RepID=UPI0007C8F4C3|nr:hypothetical protein A0O36_01799 [Piscirickettsiaceae bacterium NZ-RLO1]
MDNQAPHIRDVLNSLQQITGQPWREVQDKATMCLAFNTDLTDHTVHSTEKSMWPTRTRYVAPVAHDQEGSQESWWDKTKGFFHKVDESIVSGVNSAVNYAHNHPVATLINVGMVIVAVTPLGWVMSGVAGAAEGATLLADAVIAVRGASIGEKLALGRNMFYGLSKAAVGSVQSALLPAGIFSVAVGNYDRHENEEGYSKWLHMVLEASKDYSEALSFRGALKGANLFIKGQGGVKEIANNACSIAGLSGCRDVVKEMLGAVKR